MSTQAENRHIRQVDHDIFHYKPLPKPSSDQWKPRYVTNTVSINMRELNDSRDWSQCELCGGRGDYMKRIENKRGFSSYVLTKCNHGGVQ